MGYGDSFLYKLSMTARATRFLLQETIQVVFDFPVNFELETRIHRKHIDTIL